MVSMERERTRRYDLRWDHVERCRNVQRMMDAEIGEMEGKVQGNSILVRLGKGGIRADL